MGVGEQRVRVVAGEFRGRKLVAPKGENTRPTTDRVRESLFSALTSIMGPGLGGASVLDPFAGTGALGLEALSRGASDVTFYESDRHALEALRRNIATLGVERRCRVLSADAVSAMTRGAVPGAPFALLLLDPPYRLGSDEIDRALLGLLGSDLLEPDAIISYEHASRVGWEPPEGIEAVSAKRYGSTLIDLARYSKGAGSE
jgi:16S rRNA (guanine966-N2)-methyltransferase